MSEQSLDLIIERLKREAIDKAEEKSASLLADAQAEADRIRVEAEEQKKAMLQQAEKEAREIVEKGKSALQVAARDLSLSVRNDLLGMLRATLHKEVEESFGPDLMKAVITRLIDQLGSEVTFSLPADQKEELARFIQKKFQASAASFLLLERGDSSKGISINKTDKGWSFDISPEQVAEALLPHLNPRWASILGEKSPA